MDLHKKRMFLTFAVVILGLVMFFSQPNDYSGAAVISFSGNVLCDDFDNTGKNDGLETSSIFVKSHTRATLKKNDDLVKDIIDYCHNNGKLEENYCIKNYPYVKTKTVDCTYGCKTGACKLPPCVDPDLGKFKYTTKGTVTGLNKKDLEVLGTPPVSQYPEEFTDYCASKNALVEYYCSKGGEVMTEVKSCECSEGRCA